MIQPFSDFQIIYIKSLLLSRVPLIFASKYPTDDIIKGILKVFAETFNISKDLSQLNSPNIMILGESDKQLNVEDIIKIQNFCDSSSTGENSRLVIIKFLENLSGECVNRLLTLLESISHIYGSNICFLTNQEVSLLNNKIIGIFDTLLSRCSLVYIPQDSLSNTEESSLSICDSSISHARYIDGINPNIYVENMSSTFGQLNENSLF